MPPDEELETDADDAEMEAAFAAGAAGEAAPVEKVAEIVPVAETDELVQIKRKDWDAVQSAAARVASQETTILKLNGTVGQIAGKLKDIQRNTPRGGKIEIPEDAFGDLRKDFPEIEQSIRAGMAKALEGIQGTGGAQPVDDAQVQHAARMISRDLQMEALADMHPDWREKMGATDGAPDLNHPFRKWLASKDEAYQKKIGVSENAYVLSKAIEQFEKDTKTPPKPGPQPNLVAQAAAQEQARLRANRLRGAVQPTGDRRPPPARVVKSDDDHFNDGFAGRR